MEKFVVRALVRKGQDEVKGKIDDMIDEKLKEDETVFPEKKKAKKKD